MNYKGYQIVREELIELGTGIRSHQWAVYIGGCPRGCDYQLGVFDTLKQAKEYINNK